MVTKPAYCMPQPVQLAMPYPCPQLLPELPPFPPEDTLAGPGCLGLVLPPWEERAVPSTSASVPRSLVDTWKTTTPRWRIPGAPICAHSWILLTLSGRARGGKKRLNGRGWLGGSPCGPNRRSTRLNCVGSSSNHIHTNSFHLRRQSYLLCCCRCWRVWFGYFCRQTCRLSPGFFVFMRHSFF